VQDKGGRLKLRRDARVAPQALRGLQSAAMTLATQNATPVPVDEAVLDDETAASPLENTRLLLAEREVERRALLTELRQASRQETEAEHAHVDRIGHDILRLRHALRDVPDDQFSWTYAAMSDLMREHTAPQCLAMMTAASMRDHHDSRGAHTVDITARPSTAAASSLERRVCYATCLYIFAGTTRDVPMREISRRFVPRPRTPESWPRGDLASPRASGNASVTTNMHWIVTRPPSTTSSGEGAPCSTLPEPSHNIHLG